MIACRITGSGRALPVKMLSSGEIDRRLAKAEGWLEEQCGVRSRPVVSGDETQISLGVAATKNALEAANLGACDVDLVVSACGVGYQPLPGTAPLFQRELGIPDGAAMAFDVNATCLSFPLAIDVVAGYFATGRCSNALIISSDIATRSLPWEEQPDVAGLFGDGAAAVVIQKTDGESGLLASSFKTYPTAYGACEIGAGGTRFDFHNDLETFTAHSRFSMNGRELYRIASKYFGGFVDDLLTKAGWQTGDVDLVVPHQASPFALAHMIRQCDFVPERVVDITRDYGNQIAASIPIALSMALDAGRLQKGSKVLLLGTSAGVSLGGLALVI